ncbi:MULTISPECIES: DsbA family oxidoreductase [unclassified Sphingomonas]|uniref:DsbA family oxidoreductase n=1 Tax=unclassified Sphingomonas TaxID=196159 RepID=UPI000BCFD740|nr:MAG: disulfide bond formation protein DsbA [Sphingomonas sp. 12-62-6]OYX37567.1 MAG: disulfide bond formation protein DsbA [Sphingomonas sp. 32-62-10]
MKIDFVSDIVCPWCIIGLRALEQAIVAVSDVVAPTITFHPFELNPAMPPEGQNIVQHVAEKYGATPEQSASNRAGIRTRAAELGFAMNGTADSRIYNTFDAHRLLHWAQIEGKQAALKNRLFALYFTEGGNPSDPDALVAAAADVGLDAEEARAILAGGRYAEEVRAEERHWQSAGISSVPAIVINDKYVIIGGQPAETFERALRSIAAEG